VEKLGLIVFSVPENNPFFSSAISIIRRRAGLPMPAPGQPGPFSLANPRLLEELLGSSKFRDVSVRRESAPLRMQSADECVRFMRESFGALHQMLSGLNEKERMDTWEEIRRELGQFETGGRFTSPCELLLAIGTK
jgi:hypothetical protein